METLFYLTSIAVLLLIGIICSIIANKLKIPNVLILLLAGISLSYLRYNNQPLVTFSPVFLTSISIIALVMILFDSSSRLKLKTFDPNAKPKQSEPVIQQEEPEDDIPF